jgi:hypothetical protein
MKFYIPACSENFDFFGILELDNDSRCRLKCLRNRFVVLQMEETELVSLSFWDTTIAWYEYGHDSVPDSAMDKLADKVMVDRGVVQLSEDFAMPDNCTTARTECDKLLVSADGFWWECYPKYCDQKVHSELVPWKALDNDRC